MKHVIIFILAALLGGDVAYALFPESLQSLELFYNISLGLWGFVCLILAMGLAVLDKVIPSITEHIKQSIPEENEQQQYIKKGLTFLLSNTLLLALFTAYLVYIEWFTSVVVFTLLLVLYTTFTSRMLGRLRQGLEL